MHKYPFPPVRPSSRNTMRSLCLYLSYKSCRYYGNIMIIVMTRRVVVYTSSYCSRPVCHNILYHNIIIYIIHYITVSRLSSNDAIRTHKRTILLLFFILFFITITITYINEVYTRMLKKTSNASAVDRRRRRVVQNLTSTHTH